MINRCSRTIESQERKAARDFRRDQSGGKAGKAATSKLFLALVALMIVTYRYLYYVPQNRRPDLHSTPFHDRIPYRTVKLATVQ